MINSSGHNKTPQVRVKASPLWPNIVKLAGGTPNNFSRENNLVPILSAIRALATKKALKNTKSRVGLSFIIAWIILKKVLSGAIKREN
jgi:hypothetical protein